MSNLSYSKPRPEKIIKEQLDDLNNVKSEWLKNEEDTFAYKMKLNSISKQEQELNEELEASRMLSSDCDIEIILKGEALSGHSIQTDFLGNFLTIIQRLYNYLALTLI